MRNCFFKSPNTMNDHSLFREKFCLHTKKRELYF